MIPVIYVVIIALIVLAVTAYWAVRLENRIQRTEEAVSRLIVKVSFGTLTSLEKSEMLMFKMVSRLVVRPLLDKYDAAMRMVETLTVSKEISKAQEEEE